MPSPAPISRIAPVVLAGFLCLRAMAQTPVPVTLDPSSTIQYRVTLVGHSGLYAPGPMNATLELGAPPGAGSGPITFRRLHFSLPSFQCLVPVQGAVPVTVALSQIVVDAAPGTGAALPASLGPSGQTLFGGGTIACSTAGSASYFVAPGLSCNTLTNNGAPCSGTFDLAAAGTNTSGLVDLGSIYPGSPRTFYLRYSANFPFAAGTTWGTLDVLATLSGTLGSSTPTCRPDFNNSGTLNVQDIFDFLAAWFTANPTADFNHANGITVQDIFDFLAAWFVGC